MVRRFLNTTISSAALAAGCLVLGGCADNAEPQPRSSGADVLLRTETETIIATVPARATLESLLSGHQLPTELVQAAVDAARGVFNPRQLRAERPYRLVRTIDGWLREFEYQIDTDRFLRIAASGGERPAALHAAVLAYEKQIDTIAIRGQITANRPSLIAAVDATGENIQLAMTLAEIFGGEIDFNNDLQRGDVFEVLFEKATRDGVFAGYGPVLAASFNVDGRNYRAFRWADPESRHAGYYDADGRSLRRQLLSSPLRFEPRISSGFSRRRLHPVHGDYRAHLGVDYAAPRGSAVVAVADGVIVSAGWSGGGGNTVHIRHGSGLETFYLHLSSFAKGIRGGARVEQNQIIGRVGATGTATGPHLDYRLRRHGIFVNPITAHRQQPPGEPIPVRYLAAFRQSRDAALGRLTDTLLAAASPSKPDAVRASQPQ